MNPSSISISSQQRTLAQRRARQAWQDVTSVKGTDYQKEYSALARSATADIQLNGLGQTLAFWKAKGRNEHQALYRHVSAWVTSQLAIAGQDLLTWIMNTALGDEYRRATAEAIAFLVWLKRFAEAELGGA